LESLPNHSGFGSETPKIDDGIFLIIALVEYATEEIKGRKNKDRSMVSEMKMNHRKSSTQGAFCRPHSFNGTAVVGV
jgi:hypothetical protein